MSFWLFSCYLNRFEAILLATHWKRLGFGYAGIIYGFFLNLNSGVCFDATKTNIPVYLIHLPNKIQINREISSNLMTSKFLSLIFRFFRSIMLFANFWHKICNLLGKKSFILGPFAQFHLGKIEWGLIFEGKRQRPAELPKHQVLEGCKCEFDHKDADFVEFAYKIEAQSSTCCHLGWHLSLQK